MNKIGWILGAVLISTGAGAAEMDWDSFVAQSLAPPAGKAMKAPDAAASPGATRDITMALAKARVHWDELSPETQALAAPMFQRPDEGSGDCITYTTCVYLDPAAESVQNTAHFRIHYKTGLSAAYVTNVGTALETAYTYLVTTLAFNPPPPDGFAGDGTLIGTPTNLYDVYLAEIQGLGFNGYAMPETKTATQGYTSYVVLDDNFESSPVPLVAMRATAVHEFFHAVQFRYDADEDMALMEQSSTWVQGAMDPTNTDAYRFLGEAYTDSNGDGSYTPGEAFVDNNVNQVRDSGAMDYPHVSLDEFNPMVTATTGMYIQYGRYLWLQYLRTKFSTAPNVVRQIWEQCATVAGNNALSATETVLNSRGSTLAAAYQEYATWLYDSAHYGSGVYYSQPPVDMSVSTTVWVGLIPQKVAVYSSDSSPLLAELGAAGHSTQEHLSTLYERVKSPAGTFHFGSTGAAALSIQVKDNVGTTTWQDVPLVNGAADWTAPANTAEAVLVISNVSPTADGMTWSFTGGNLADLTKGTEDRTSSSVGGGGALDWLALSLGGLVYLRRRSR